MPIDDRHPRVTPLEPPYEPAVAAGLRQMMPRHSSVPPLKAFRTFVRHPALADAMLPLGRLLLGRELSISLHDRELVIDRVCARCGCEYEWGVHAVYFAAKAGLSSEQLAATVTAGAGDAAWSATDALLIRLVDALHDTAAVPAPLWDELAAHWTVPQLLELLMLVGWYHAIAFLINGLQVEREEWALRFPA